MFVLRIRSSAWSQGTSVILTLRLPFTSSVATIFISETSAIKRKISVMSASIKSRGERRRNCLVRNRSGPAGNRKAEIDVQTVRVGKDPERQRLPQVDRDQNHRRVRGLGPARNARDGRVRVGVVAGFAPHREVVRRVESERDAHARCVARLLGNLDAADKFVIHLPLGRHDLNCWHRVCRSRGSCR